MLVRRRLNIDFFTTSCNNLVRTHNFMGRGNVQNQKASIASRNLGKCVQFFKIFNRYRITSCIILQNQIQSQNSHFVDYILCSKLYFLTTQKLPLFLTNTLIE